MHHDRFKEHVDKRSRLLLHSLIISVALNLGLLATFMTFILKEKRFDILLHQERAFKRIGSFSYLPPKNADVMLRYSESSFSYLLQELENNKPLEQGYQCCDLALAALVAYYHFDIERALPGILITKRPFLFSKSREAIDLITGLDQEKMQAIRYFAKSEIWPLTSEGLFLTLQNQREAVPDSLKEAFCMTKEFFEIERAFSRLPFVFTRDTLLHLLLDGDWAHVSAAASEIYHHPQGELENMGPFLSGFTQSKLAAYLLVSLAPDYAYLSLSNERLENLIGHLDEQTEEAAVFLEKITTSLRPNEIREKASTKMGVWGNEITLRSPSEEYIIQRGDSLWSLSKQFGVPIEALRLHNALETDLLTPGRVLKIPENY